MRYILNPFKWLIYLYRRIKYRNSNFISYYAPKPYSKKEIEKAIKKMEKEANIFFGEDNDG